MELITEDEDGFVHFTRVLEMDEEELMELIETLEAHIVQVKLELVELLRKKGQRAN